MKKTEQDEATIPDAPEHLSARSKELWRSLVRTEAKSLERQTLFQAGLEALDRADEARLLVQAEGMIARTTTTGAVHVHPAVKMEREARSQFVRIWDLLGLKWNEGIDGGNPW